MEEDGKLEKGNSGVVMAVDSEDNFAQNYTQFFDDMSGEPLDHEGVLAARKEELTYVHKHCVCTRRYQLEGALNAQASHQLAHDGLTLTRVTMFTPSTAQGSWHKKLMLRSVRTYLPPHHPLRQ